MDDKCLTCTIMRKADLIAGISVAGLLLPEAVAYASIAGLPTQRAILAAIAGCLVYALAGRSRFAIVSATSSSAAILAATLAAIPVDASAKAGLATVAVLLCGLLLLLAAAFRMGGLTGLISRPVLRGFALGLAITIIIHQLPRFAGIDTPQGGILTIFADLLSSAGTWNPYSVVLGGAALVVLLLLRRFPFVPGAFLALCLGVVASLIFSLADRSVALVGQIDLMVSFPHLSASDWPDYLELARYVLPLVLILFAESWGTISSLALRHGDAVAANRELGALGLANLASFMVQGMPVGAGFSAGSAAEAAGAKSRATSAVAAVGLGALMWLAMPYVAMLPQPVVAAVVIFALGHSLDPTPFLRLWRWKRDHYVALLAALSVLIFGVLDGMLIAIALSIALLIKRLAVAQMAQLGRLPDSHDFVDTAYHPEAQVDPLICIWRPSEPLFFGNASRIFDAIADDIQRRPDTRAIIVSLEESFDLDSTTFELLVEFATRIASMNKELQLARVHDHVRAFLQQAGQPDLLARSSYSVDDAYRLCRARVDQLERISGDASTTAMPRAAG